MNAGGAEPRLIVQLIEARSTTICLSARYPLPQQGAAAAISELACAVAGQLGGVHGAIVRHERERLRHADCSPADAHELYIRAGDGLDCDDRDSAVAALALAERCIGLEPRFGRGWLMLGWRRNQVYSYGWGVQCPGWLAEEETIFRRAVDLEPRDPMALAFLAISRAKRGAMSEAQRLMNRAAELSAVQPDAAVEMSLGMCTIAGQAPRALAMIDHVLDLYANPPAQWGYMEGRAAFFAGRNERALEATDCAPDCLPKFVYRALAATELADWAEADACLKRLEAQVPQFSFDWYARNQAISHPAALARYKTAVAKLYAKRCPVNVLPLGGRARTPR